MAGNFELELISLMEEKKMSYEQAYERLDRKHKQLQLAKERKLAKNNKTIKKKQKRGRKKNIPSPQPEEEINSHELLENN